MDFSVLQSVYKKDNPKFLSESLQSIKNNTVQPAAIVLVKDGTLTPELEAVIIEWQEKLPLKVVGYEQNQGLAYALNYGLQFVETELVARMDSDDICYPNRFEKQLKYFEQKTEVEILGTGISEFYISKNNEEFRHTHFYPQISDSTSKTLFKGTPVGHPTVMLKTKLLKEFKYAENTTMNEDIELWFRLIKSGHSIYNLQEPLVNFRITDATFNRRNTKKAFNEFKIYWENLYEIFGLSPLLIYPIARFLVRFLPYRINKKLYFSKVRNSVLK
jgi:glycosyltransferase involved in cell wall biosynthesis